MGETPGSSDTAGARPGDGAGAKAAAEFDRDVAQFLQEYFEAEPVGATFFGLTEWDAQLPDFTADGFVRREAAAGRWLEHFSTAGGTGDTARGTGDTAGGTGDTAALTQHQRTDLALLRAHLGQQVATAGFAPWRRYPTTYLENGVFELFVHGTRDEAAATAAAVERVRQVPAALAAGRENLDPALVDAELLAQWALPNTAAQAAFMREGLEVFVEKPAHREALRKAGAEAAEAYEEFGVYLADLATRATGSFVYGKDNYDAVLRTGEGFGFDVQTLREMGREQVASLDARMGPLAEKIGGTSDWRVVVSGLRDDHPSSMDDLLRCYREETARARAFVRESGLVSIPEGEECAVEPAPLFLRAAAPVASYFPPPSFGRRAHGTFNVPFTPDDATPAEQEARLRSNSYFEIPGVTAHEAYPGHHLHFAAAQSPTAQGATALRQVLQSTYMVEGWGLYVENMMGEARLLPVAGGKAGAAQHAPLPGRADRGRHQPPPGRDEHGRGDLLHGGALRIPGAHGAARGPALLLLSHPGLLVSHRGPGDRADGPGVDDSREGHAPGLPRCPALVGQAPARGGVPGHRARGLSEQAGRVGPACRPMPEARSSLGVGCTPEREIRP